MKNERGLTLVELLASLAIFGIILALIGSILITGIKTANRNTLNQQMQQEANYITEVVRKEYLRKNDKNIMDNTITFNVDNDVLKMNGTIISRDYQYTVSNIVRTDNPTRFSLTIEKDGLHYNVNTTFSKLE
ncbi:hypothetical protein SLU01_06360 [Sporosarcina luteola]|uniref:Prepilin-type N-terminal cleavage/methylation domain-containing protein n=1 Tax=Sporosarcina luteola TaxID=582850 RepID=A0A511Z4E5_9BACL|nr:type II secretion system protein [Sporosarcina luteola]GEN82324.1 hypothetical protein SLU01_06360 [Sporosarcina luteola]